MKVETDADYFMNGLLAELKQHYEENFIKGFAHSEEVNEISVTFKDDSVITILSSGRH